MVERIRALLESRQLTPTQFADLIGVARPIVSHILSGRNKPSLEVVQRILAAMPELAMPWLLNGSGPMLSSAGALGLEEAPTASAPAASAPALPSTPAHQNSTEAPAIEPVLPEQPADKQYNTVPNRAVGASVPSTRNLVGKQPDKVAVPANRVGKPAPFKPASIKPIGMPRRFVATPVAAGMPANINKPAVTLQHGPVEQPSVAVSPTSVAGPDLVASPLLAIPQPPAQVPIATDSEPVMAGKTPGSAMAQALFDGAEKPIRRIVIFYRDGSFADYQPE